VPPHLRSTVTRAQDVHITPLVALIAGGDRGVHIQDIRVKNNLSGTIEGLSQLVVVKINRLCIPDLSHAAVQDESAEV